MAEKQPHLNGAYYGPSIPPRQTYHRPGRDSDCGGGCFCCLFSCLFKVIFSLAISIGIAVFIFWLVVRPHRVKFHVTDATLTQFNLTTDNMLHYNLAVNISVRNPNKKIAIYYDRIEARAFYGDNRFDAETLTPFYQGHKNTTLLNPVFQGQQLLVLADQDLTQFNQDKAAGTYNIEVKMYLKLRFKIGWIKVGKFKPKIECDLKVPLNGTGGGYETTKCDVDF